MEINIKRIRSSLSLHNKDVIDEGNEFISLINDELFNDDLVVKENSKKGIFDIVFIETGGVEGEFVKNINKFSKPFILLSSEKNNSLPACFEIKTYLDSIKEDCVLLVGNEEKIAFYLRFFAKLMSAKKKIDNTNLGVIGEPSDWLIASKVKDKDVKEHFNINLINISSDELKDEINKHEYKDVPHLSTLIKKYKNKDVLNGALDIYGALTRLVAKYSLSGLTIRCFDLLSEYKNTACLALALLNERGIVSACEGDVPSLLTMYFIKALIDQPSFQANPSKIDFDNKKLLLAHCTVPLNMVDRYELVTHFESGLGIGIKGNLKKENCSIIKLCPDLVHSIAFNSSIVEIPSYASYCRTQIEVSLEDEEFMSLLQISFGNHLIVSYTEVSDLFMAFIDLLNGINYYPKHRKLVKKEEK